MRIYLDSCCLNRPFDDVTQVRIASEADTVSAILKLCESGQWVLLTSDALEFEAGQAAEDSRRVWLEETLINAREYVAINEQIIRRAAELEGRGFKNIDAIHIASAEAVNAACFCTCDDRLLRLARRQTDLQIRIASLSEIAQELET